MPASSDHERVVEAWLTKHATGKPARAVLQAFENSFGVLWDEVRVTLGDVTLVAIGERVVSEVAERHPPFSSLRVQADGVDFRALRLQLPSLDARELHEAIRTLLIELLTIIGRLTAEILTPEMHATLSVDRPANRTSPRGPRNSDDSSDGTPT